MRTALLLAFTIFQLGCLPWTETVNLDNFARYSANPNLIPTTPTSGLRLVAFGPLQGFGSPEYIKSKFEEKLHPYFQNAKVVLEPEQHALLGLTCIEGAGPELAKTASEALGKDLGPNGLMEIATRTLLAVRNYRYVVLGFDTYLAGFDLQTMRSYYKPISDAAYGQLYRRECGLGSAVNSTPTDDRECQHFVQDFAGGPLRCATP